jgi:hypothetical protein
MMEGDQSGSERARAAYHQERRGRHQADRFGARGNGCQRNQAVDPGNCEKNVVVGTERRVAESVSRFGTFDQR